MSPRLSLQERVQCGLALIEESLIAFIRENPGLTGKEIDEKLGFPPNAGSSGFSGIFGMTLRKGIPTLERKNGR